MIAPDGAAKARWGQVHRGHTRKLLSIKALAPLPRPGRGV
jgi:hypothetical protein